MLRRRAATVSRVFQIVVAVILAQTLFFKFTGAEESIHIFRALGAEPVGRVGSGVIELVAVVLVLVPRTAVLGALLALGVVAGAIASHLAVLGIEVMGDGGLLFALALIVLACSSGILVIRRKQIPLIGRRMEDRAPGPSKGIVVSRLARIDPKSATGRTKDLLDGPFRALQVNLIKAMAHSPAALEGFGGLHGALSTGLLSLKEREAIQLAIAQANGCESCQAAHTAIAKSAGMTDAQALEARRGRPSDAKIAALVRFALALDEKRGHVSDSEVQAFRAAGYTDAHLTEVIANHALATLTNTINVFNRTPVDFPTPPKA